MKKKSFKSKLKINGDLGMLNLTSRYQLGEKIRYLSTFGRHYDS
jgi:hypothetical protein